MATRGLLASLVVVVLVSSPVHGQWTGQMGDAYWDNAYNVKQASFSTGSAEMGGVESEIPPAPFPPEDAPIPTTPGPYPPPGGPGSQPIAPSPAVTEPTPPAPYAVADGVAPAFMPGAPENSPCAADGGGYWCPPNWRVEQNVRILARSRTRYTPLSRENVYNEMTGTYDFVDIIGTKSLTFDVAGGYSTVIAHYLGFDTCNRDWFMEFDYWGLNQWDTSRTMSGSLNPFGHYNIFEQFIIDGYTGSLQSYFDPVFSDGQGHYYGPGSRRATLNEKILSDAFTNVLQHDFDYTSNIHDFELNFRIQPRGRPDRLVLYPNGRWRREREPGCFMSYLAGFRSILVNERLDFAGLGYTRYEPNDEDIRRINNNGLYRIVTQNTLVGLQIGGDLKFRERLWEFGARYKLGPMLNFAKQMSDVTGEETTIYGNGSSITEYGSVYRKDTNCEVSGVAEIGVEGVYKITPNLTVRAAYDWLFITNLALAPEQIDYTIIHDVPHYDNSRVNTNGHALYHGLTLGLEFNW